MKSFVGSMIDACTLLQDITKERSECISALVQADPLVKWLKGTMKKGEILKLKVKITGNWCKQNRNTAFETTENQPKLLIDIIQRDHTVNRVSSSFQKCGNSATKTLLNSI